MHVRYANEVSQPTSRQAKCLSTARVERECRGRQPFNYPGILQTRLPALCQAGVQRAAALCLGSGAVPQVLTLLAAAGGTLANEVGQTTRR